MFVYTNVHANIRTSIAPLKVVDHNFRKASEWTIMLPWFQNVLSSSNFRKIVSNSARVHHFVSLLFQMFSAVPTTRTTFQIASECTIYCPCFQHFLIFFHFQKHQNAPFCVLSFKDFSAVPTLVYMPVLYIVRRHIKSSHLCTYVIVC